MLLIIPGFYGIIPLESAGINSLKKYIWRQFSVRELNKGRRVLYENHLFNRQRAY